ncbi:MAG: extensin family protein [Deltaproteobacteria bacterium]|nr:extensin family protein [Deltaproteobacteria bacterium]
MSLPRLALAVVVALTSLAGLGGASLAAPSPDDDLGRYGLDGVSREIDPKKKPSCPDLDFVTYRGTSIPYDKPAKTYVGFAPRLAAFEEVARRVAVEVYGRAPRRLRHLGVYNCRRIGGYPNLLSEHGLMNGIDVAGFELPALKKGEKAPADLPKRLRRAFTVTVKDHWSATGAVGSVHSRFLHRLTEELVARPDIFRVMLGPAYPGHKDHFHFDCAPYRLIDL